MREGGGREREGDSRGGGAETKRDRAYIQLLSCKALVEVRRCQIRLESYHRKISGGSWFKSTRQSRLEMKLDYSCVVKTLIDFYLISLSVQTL